MIGQNENVERTIAIEVGERSHYTAIDHRQTPLRGFFFEGAVALVYIKQVRRMIAANIEIEQAVIVYIRERSPLTPDDIVIRRHGSLDPTQQ